MKNKIIGIIPARYNSTRFLGKLLYKIGLKTLLHHTYDNVKACSIFNELYIVTEDEVIKKEACSINAKCIMTGKCTNGTQRIIEALKNNKNLQTSKIIVNVQGDHPKISSDTIIKTVNILNNDKTAVVSTAAIKVSFEKAFSSNHIKCVFDKEQNALYFSRSLIPYSKNEKEIDYYYHVGIYAYKTSFLYELAKLEDTQLQKIEDLEQLKILEHGYRMKVAIVDDMPLGVDVFEDVKKVEKVLCQ
jgi:3-deoxy-manno-octulosonate cytidylyltransferase (CMP-KDO synthetase)